VFVVDDHHFLPNVYNGSHFRNPYLI